MLTAPARLTRVGGATRLLTPEDAAAPIGEPDPAIVRVLVKAHDWAERLKSGAASSLKEIAASEDVSPRYVARLLPLAFLAPAIVDRLLAGDHPKALTVERFTR